MKYYDIYDIKRINKNTGHYFFEPDTMRFFRSRVGDSVYNGIGGVYFVTSEQFVSYYPHYTEHTRKYTVRQFNPETGDIDTVGDFNELTRYMAHKIAKQLSEGDNND